MDQPWGLSGPQFLALYGAVLVVWCLVVAVARMLVKRQRSSSSYSPDLYERAFLNGGVDRVSDTALAGLIENGWVRATRSRKLHRLRTTADDEAQRVVSAGLGGKSKLDPVRKAFRGSGYCDTMRQRLVDEGLLVNPGGHAVLRGLVWGFPLLALIAVVRGINGVRLGYPVGFLIVEFLLTVGVWAVAAMTCRPPLPTRAGDALRKPDLPGSPSGLVPRNVRRGQSLGSVTAAELVAIGGLGAYPDPTVARLLQGSGSGGGGFVGGSSSCGGGGGGGCGGGGGGG